jgi:predicted RNase H-like nuclease (RuvC/YqgF family)
VTASTVLTLVGILIAVVVAFAGVVGTAAAMRLGKNTTVLSNYKASAESAQSVADSLKSEVEQLRAELAEAKATAAREREQWSAANAELMARISILQDLATGHSTLEALGRQLENSLVAKVGELRTDMLAEFERTRKVIGSPA